MAWLDLEEGILEEFVSYDPRRCANDVLIDYQNYEAEKSRVASREHYAKQRLDPAFVEKHRQRARERSGLVSKEDRRRYYATYYAKRKDDPVFVEKQRLRHRATNKSRWAAIKADKEKLKADLERKAAWARKNYQKKKLERLAEQTHVAPEYSKAA